MRAKCSQCQAVSQADLPILLVVCPCGHLLKFRPQPADLASPPAGAAEVDPYETLGLSPPVSDEQVRSAYRERAKACHPDRGGDAAEFDAVTIAYKSVRDAESRHRFETSRDSAAHRTVGSLLVPDLIARRADEVSSLLEETPLVPRVVIVPVDSRDVRARRVVGQLPVPGSRVDAGTAIGIVFAIPRSSTLWYRARVYATEVAGSFFDGFLRGGGISSGPKELPSGTQPVGTQIAGSIGEVAGATMRAGVGVASCLLRLWAISFGLLVVAVLMWASPPVGVMALALLVWLAIRSSIARSKRKDQGIWY